MSAKFSTNKEKPYFVCPIDDNKFVRTQNDWVVHVIQNHAIDAEERAPKVCRDFIKVCRTFFEESD